MFTCKMNLIMWTPNLLVQVGFLKRFKNSKGPERKLISRPAMTHSSNKDLFEIPLIDIM